MNAAVMAHLHIYKILAERWRKPSGDGLEEP
jgi:hypothetical protein